MSDNIPYSTDFTNSDAHFIETFCEVERKCFVNAPEPSVMATFGQPMDQNWIMTDDEMLAFIRDQDRTPRRAIFSDPSWMKRTNQQQAGSCQCWTDAECMSGCHMLRTGSLIIFDGAYPYSLLNNGVDHGSAVIDGLKLMCDTGDITVDDNPDPMNIWRRNTTKFDSLAGRYKFLESTTITLKSAREIKSFILRGNGFVNLVVMVDNGSRFASYKTGLMPVTRGIGNHSITGFDVVEFQGKPWILCKNHWSANFGMAGYGILDDAALTETIPVHGCWGVQSTVEKVA